MSIRIIAHSVNHLSQAEVTFASRVRTGGTLAAINVNPVEISSGR